MQETKRLEELTHVVGAEDAVEATTQIPAGAPPEAIGWINFLHPEGLFYAVVILVVMAGLARFIASRSEKLEKRFADRRLTIQQTTSFLRFFIYLFGLSLAALTLFDPSREVLLAIGGTFAVAAGFALKDLGASIVAGVIILIDRPFQVGDRVTFDGHYGEITGIGLRSVKLMTLDDTQITIPNNRFLTDTVASGNAGAIDMMIQVDLHIGVDQDLEKARELLSEVITTSRYVNPNRRWAVQAQQVIEQSYMTLRLQAKAYVLDARLEKEFQGDITKRALRAFKEAGIGPPAVLHRTVE